MSIRKTFLALSAAVVVGLTGLAATTTTASAQYWDGGPRYHRPPPPPPYYERRHHYERSCWFEQRRYKVRTPWGWEWRVRRERVCN